MIQTTRNILKILDKPQKTMIVVIGIMMFLGGIMESLSVSLVLPLITVVMDSATWNEPWYAKAICGIFCITEQRKYVEVLLLLLAAVFILKNLYLLAEYYIQYSFIAKSRYRMQRGLMHRYIHKPYSFYLNATSGEIIRIITGDTSQAFLLLSNLLQFYTEAFICAILGLTTFIISPMMALWMILILLMELIAVSKVIKPIMKRNGEKQRAKNAVANKWMLQAISGIKSIKVARKEDYFEEEYSNPAEIVLDIDRKNQTLSRMPAILIEAFTMTGVLLMLFFMVLSGVDLKLLVPQLSAFAVAAMKLLPSVNKISSSINQIPFLEGGLSNVLRILKAENMMDNEDKDENDVKELDKISFSRNIYMDNITFAYLGLEEKVLDHAQMKIYPGQSVGIVGPSGAGKTTTVDIILGLLSPQEGKITVDGLDIRANMQSWLSNVAYIPQQIFLIDDSIRANVAFGVKEPETNDSKIWEALRESQLEQFVRELPNGLDTVVGEQGIRLSGGQKQRLGIARALYGKPKVLFFDEATSALDNETESAIMESINHLKGKVTLIIIAHRLSTIDNCDVIFRVQDKKIILDKSKQQ